MLIPGMAGFIEGPQVELAVGPNYEQFDGVGNGDNGPIPEKNPESSMVYPNPVDNRVGPSNRGSPTPVDEQVYTQGPIVGVVGTLGGQPWPAKAGVYRAASPTGGSIAGAYTPARANSVQFRLGVGQAGPSELGVAQTVKLSEITSNPPEPGDLTSILAGLG